jgi:hypothetical protein
MPGRLWHLLANQTLFEVTQYHRADRRHQGCSNMGTGDFGTSPIFGQLSDKPLLAGTKHLGCRDVKHKWRIETLKPMTERFL